MQELKKKVIRTGSIVAFAHVFSQVLRLSGNLILTRLLVPEMFGLMAMVTVFMGGLAMFSDIGLLQNVVQSKRGEEKSYLHTAWTIQIIRGFLIFFIALLISYGLYILGDAGLLSSSNVYGDKQLPLILAVVSITAVISGFNSINIFVLRRNLMMGRVVAIELISQSIGLTFSIVWAWYSQDIWALVYGGIVSALMKLWFSHSNRIGEKCHFIWDKTAAYEILHFGKWIFAASIFGFLLNQGDRILLGGMISAEVLGVYTIAFFLSNALKDVFSKMFVAVFFPLLSDVVRNAPDRLESVYYKIRLQIDFATMTTAGFLFSAGGIVVKILYDSRYDDAAWMLEILAISIVSIGFILSDHLFTSLGKPKYLSYMKFIEVVSLFILVPLCFHNFGLVGAIWAIALNPLVRIFSSMVLMNRICFFNFYREVMLFPLFGVGYILGELLWALIENFTPTLLG